MGRSPCGERGLKYDDSPFLSCGEQSLPLRGAWIEIVLAGTAAFPAGSLPVRGAWIEIRSVYR